MNTSQHRSTWKPGYHRREPPDAVPGPFVLFEAPTTSPSQEDRINRIVVGLGNPGEQYRDTRHNIGWMVLDRLADRAGIAG